MTPRRCVHERTGRRPHLRAPPETRSGQPAVSNRRQPNGQVAPVDFRPHIVIVTKRKIYNLEPEVVSQPVGEVLDAAMRDAKRYITKDSWMIGRPEQPI